MMQPLPQECKNCGHPVIMEGESSQLLHWKVYGSRRSNPICSIPCPVPGCTCTKPE